MRYTIYEVASVLGTSHTTIYNKLKNREIRKELKQFITRVGNKQYINVEGVNVLRQHIKVDSVVDSEHAPEQESNNFGNVGDINGSKVEGEGEKFTSRFTTLYERQIEQLTEQLKAKDKQLETLLRLNENNQSLIMQAQKRLEILEQDSRASKSIWRKFWK
jgi:predicted transcriptional regulator YheO